MVTGSCLRPDLGLYCYGGIYNTGQLDNYGAVNIYGQLNPQVQRVKNSMVIGNCKWGSSLGNTNDTGQFTQLIGDGIAANISSVLAGNFTNIVAIGSSSLEQLNGTRTDMIAIGYRSARYANSQTSIAIGTGTMQNIGYNGSSATNNIAIGHLSMGQMGSSGNSNNCCVGNSTLYINDFTNSRSFNCVFGNSSGTNISSNYHTIVGYGSFQNNISESFKCNSFPIYITYIRPLINPIGNNIINITLTNFGNEKYTKLTNEEQIRILKSNKQCIANLIKFLHINDRLPEYKNICIKNLRGKGGYLYEGNKWLHCNFENLLMILFKNKINDLEKILNSNEGLINYNNNYIQNLIENYTDNMDTFIKNNKDLREYPNKRRIIESLNDQKS
jgi:hypothetical protein